MREPRLTITEAVSALMTLERPMLHGRVLGRERFTRWVRLVLVDHKLSYDMRVLQRGTPRLFTAVDVAMVRLAWRLRQQGLVSAWASRAALTYMRGELAACWHTGDRKELRIVGVLGELVDVRRAPEDPAAWMPAVWAGVPDAVQAVRDETPRITMYRREVTPAAVLRAQAREGVLA